MASLWLPQDVPEEPTSLSETPAALVRGCTSVFASHPILRRAVFARSFSVDMLLREVVITSAYKRSVL